MSDSPVVRAKLYVASVTRQAGSPDAIQVTLGAVTRGEENRSWAEASPAGQFNMTIQNPNAAVQFALGREFYVDFIVAQEPVTLADGHKYEPTEHEAARMREAAERGAVDASTHYRCQACGCKRSSHEEPARSKLVEWRP